MSKLVTIKQNWNESKWWREVFIPMVKNNICNLFAKFYYSLNNIEFISVPDADWDNLLILDACRYDFFDEINDIEGSLTKTYSQGSNSMSFLRRNFGNDDFSDIVVVTGNPYQKKVLDDTQFHKVYHVWSSHWDKELQTVRPEAVTDVALEAAETHPNKRLLIHYMQPHFPFIGPWAQKHIGVTAGNLGAREAVIGRETDPGEKTVFRRAETGEISNEVLKRAYRENVEIAIEHASILIEKLSGKTVVTADHGEMLGERAWPFPWQEYQHPGILAKKLIEVPWLVVEGNQRKEIIKEPPRGSEAVEEAKIQDRLESLGYT